MRCAPRNRRTAVLATAVAAAASACLVPVRSASAAVHTWNGSTDANWNTAANWSSNAVPNANTEDVVFNTPAAGNLNVNANTGTLTIRSLTFNADATSPVTLNVNATNLFTIAGQTGDDVTVTAGAHRIGGPAAGAPPDIKFTATDFNIAAGASLEINARIGANATSNSYTKSGAGTLIFTAQNGGTGGWNFTGGTFTINGGAVVCRVSQATGNSSNRVTVNSGGVLQLENGSYVSTNGALTLNNGGTLRAVGAGLTRTVGTGTGAIVLNGTSNLEAVDGTMQLTQDLTGSGSWIKQGAGTLLLNDGGANPVSSYTGNSTIATGTVALSATGSFGASPRIDVQAGAALNTTLAGSGAGYSVAANQTIGGNGTVYGSLNLAGTNSSLAPGLSPGTLTFSSQDANPISLTLTAGQLSLDLANVTTVGSGVNDLIVVNGNLVLNGSTNLNINRLNGALTPGTYTILQYTGALSGAGTLNAPVVRQGLTVDTSTAGQINLIAGAGAAGNLLWKGDGSSSTWQTNGANVWLNGASADKYFDWDDVTFSDDLGSNSSNLTVSGTIVPNTISINNSAVDYTFGGGGQITGVNTLTKTGSRTATFSNSGGLNVTALNANNGTLILATPTAATNVTVGGGALRLISTGNFASTTVNTGTLEIGDGATAGSIVGPVTNNAWVSLNNPGDSAYSTVFSGTGTIEKKGAGIATFSANNSAFTGTLLVSGGTIKPTNTNALGSTSAGDVVIPAGSALDLQGGAGGDTLNFGTRTFHVAGTGPGSAGVIVNSGTTRQFSAFQFIKLDADSTFSGFRFDMGRNGSNNLLDLNGKRLTLNFSGTQPMFGIQTNATVTAGTIEVVAGALDVERNALILADGAGSNMIFNPGTNLQTFESAAGKVTRPMIFKGGNTIGAGSAVAAVLDGPMRLEGDVTIQPQSNGVPNTTGTGTLSLNGAITDDGGARSITKNGPNMLVLGGGNTYGGNTTVNVGTLRLATAGSVGAGQLSNLNGTLIDVVAGRTDAVKVSALNLAGSGTLDLHDNDMIVGNTTPMSTVENYVRTARNNGTWDAPGMTSSEAKANPQGTTTLGVISGADYTLFGGTGTFSNKPYASTDTLVKYTWNGDANFSGQVNFDDYVRTDVGFNSGFTGWSNGDFNYSGAVDFDDYVLIDVAFNTQSGTLGRAVRYLSGDDRSENGLDDPSVQKVIEHFDQFGLSYANAFLAAVPEPGSLIGAGTVTCATMLRRRRRR